ncbi:hypothetical protein [Quadrisphaera granulorum]|uniref:hypothetical protein n=1 Tax=Quadrisphaera granulorum TaxID=317664 RepID=UPI001B87C252|nr:hypothetical protein [Quadrisphaera granulorum]
MPLQTTSPLSLDGRRFVMASSTASAVDPHAPTRFAYHETAGAVWGEYEGDTVVLGRFIGTREGAALNVSFVHVLKEGGAVVTGTSTSTVEPGPRGLLLRESFAIDGVDHESVCVELL